MEGDLKILGYHMISDNDHLLIDFLFRKVYAPPFDLFPIIYRKLYSGNPWTVLGDDLPWDILNSHEASTVVKRRLFIFTKLNFSSNSKIRFDRTAGNGTWYGTTGQKEVLGEDGRVLGWKSCFVFKDNENSPKEFKENGEWSMNEYSLKAADDKKIETVLCVITNEVKKDSEIRLLWRKSPLEIFFEKFQNRGYFREPGARDPQLQQEEGSSSTDDMQTAMVNGQEDNL